MACLQASLLAHQAPGRGAVGFNLKSSGTQSNVIYFCAVFSMTNTYPLNRHQTGKLKISASVCFPR